MKRILGMLAGALMALLISCEHKDLCLQHPHVATVWVTFDWRNAPGANPDGMCVFFYPMDEEGRSETGNAVIRYDFKGTGGGEVELQVGRYRAICYNNDTEGILFSNTGSFGTHYGYTRQGDIFETVYGNTGTYAPRADGSEDERVVITPDMMWGSNVWDIEVTDFGLCYACDPSGSGEEQEVNKEEYVITFYPAELVCTYTYEIRNVTNMKNVTNMCASLSGMSGGLYFGTEELDKKPVTLPIEAVKHDETTIVGRFYTFGHYPDNVQEHRLLLYVWLTDGQKVYYGSENAKFNVTQQIHSASDKRNVHIIIDGLDFPQAIENGSGYQVDIDDWYEENIDITM